MTLLPAGRAAARLCRPVPALCRPVTVTALPGIRRSNVRYRIRRILAGPHVPRCGRVYRVKKGAADEAAVREGGGAARRYGAARLPGDSRRPRRRGRVV